MSKYQVKFDGEMDDEIFYETYKGYRFIRDEIIRRYGVIFKTYTSI